MRSTNPMGHPARLGNSVDLIGGRAVVREYHRARERAWQARPALRFRPTSGREITSGHPRRSGQRAPLTLGRGRGIGTVASARTTGAGAASAVLVKAIAPVE